MAARRKKTESEALFDVAVGMRIVNARKVREVGQTELAHAVGITQQRMYAIESGQRCPGYLLVKVAAVLRCDVRLFLVNNTQL